MTTVRSELPTLSIETILTSISTIAHQIQHMAVLDEVVQQAITDAKSLLGVDRVVVCQLSNSQEATVTFETVSPDLTATLGQRISSSAMNSLWGKQPNAEAIAVVSNIYTAPLATDVVTLLTSWQVQAYLAMPLISQGQRWGVLMAQHCQGIRGWQPLETQYGQQLAVHLGIAIQQAALQPVLPYCADKTEQHSNHLPTDATWSSSPACHMALNAHDWSFWVRNFVKDEVFLSPCWRALRGFAADELPDCWDTWVQSIHPQDRDRILQALQAYLTRDATTFEQDYRICRADGSYHWVLSQGKALWNQFGEPIQITGLEIDITARKQAELTLQKNDQRFQHLATASPAVIYTVVEDLHGIAHFEYLSPAAEAIHELPIADILADSSLISNQMHPDDRDGYHQAMIHSLETQEPFSYEWRIITPSGKVKWLQANSCPSRQASGELVWHGIVLDVSDRKHKDELIQNIARGVSAATGAAFFQLLVEYLSQLLNINHVCIAELIAPSRNKVRVLAGLSYGQSLASLEHDLPNTPCQQVVEQGFCVYPDHLQHYFPENRLLCNLHGESYAGIALVNSAGIVIGIISIISDRAMHDHQLIEEVLTIFAVRAASELERQQSEVLLRRYERIVSATPDCVVLLDCNYYYQAVNDSYLRWHHKTLPEVIGHHVSEILGQEIFTTIVKPLFDCCLATQSPRIAETWITTSDHQQQYVRATLAPCTELDGSVSGIVINITDVSQLKQAELENQSLRERLQFLLAASPGIIYSCTVDGHFRYTFISDTVQTLLGYTAVEWLATPNMWVTNLHPDDAPHALNCLMPLLANNHHTHEYRLRHRDGHYTWVRDEMQLVRNPEGEVLEIVGCWVTIDDRKASELALAESQRHYQTLVENSPDIIERFDVKLRHLYVSPSLTKMIGIPVDACLGKTYRELGLDAAVVNQWEAAAATLLATGQKQVIEFSIPTLQGVRSFEMALVPELSAQQTIQSILCISRDVTDRKAAEVALHEQQLFIQQIAESTLAILYVYDLLEQQMVYTSPQITTVLGYSPDELQAMGGNLFSQLLHPDDLPSLIAHHQQLQANDYNDYYVEAEYRIRHRSGRYRWLLSRDRVLNCTPEGKPRQIVGVAVDITLLKHTQITLHQQAERERLVTAIAQKIRQTLDLEQVLQTTVTEVRQFLQVDRVVIYQFTPNWSGVIVAESVVAGWQSILGMHITDTYFVDTQGKFCLQGHTYTIDDTYTANLHPCYLDLLERMQVRAKLVVPILQQNHLWGLLVAQHCQAPRHWETWEVDLHHQLATQLAIAIQQSELYQQVQALNASLELQVQERTAQLQQALTFESLLKRIIDRVRDSLDEEQILQSVVEELAQQLALVGCDTGIYNAEHTIATITHEFTVTLTPAQGKTVEIATAPHAEIYQYLLQGQWCQFCSITPTPLRSNQQFLSVLAVPIVDDQGVLGDLWLFKPPSAVFDNPEVRLVQQVANQCAIALRQSRLYQAAQAQVKELERLNLLKDDFLSTVSHELRSPMASIKMATQMLEISLRKEKLLTDETHPINRYLKVLHEEEDREINLINDLLDLARVDAGTEPLNLTTISLQCYLPHLAESFAECARQQQQQLTIEIPDDFPPLTTDLATLERIITELLHNACKYTPPEGMIGICCYQLSDPYSPDKLLPRIQIAVSNSGVEIPASEQQRIFDKFYRIPKHDPWKHGGTGLGLALVKKLTERLGGYITVHSADRCTTFTLELALHPSLPSF